MEFALDVVLFVLASVLVAVCIIAVPGPPSAGAQGSPSSGHHPSGH